jgi:hypothetical protein
MTVRTPDEGLHQAIDKRKGTARRYSAPRVVSLNASPFVELSYQVNEQSPIFFPHTANSSPDHVELPQAAPTRGPIVSSLSRYAP